MTNTKDLTILLLAKDEATSVITRLGDSMKSNFAEAEKASKYVAIGLAAAGTAAATFGYFAVKAAQENESAQTRLATILRTSTKATDEQIASLISQAEALEKIGVVSKSQTLVAQGQLATFDLTTSAIKKLTPAILDYAVAEKGVNVTTDELQQMTNGLAQALQGNFTSLTKTGFVLDDVTKGMIKNGTETERVEALVKVLNSTYKDHNAVMRETSEGGAKVLRMAFENMKETIGSELLPVFDKLVGVATEFSNNILPLWIEKTKEIVSWLKEHKIVIGIVAGAIIGALIPAFIAFATTLITVTIPALAAMAIALAPYIIGGAIIGGVVAGVLWVVKNWELVKEKTLEIWGAIRDFFASTWECIKNTFEYAINGILDKLKPLISAINTVKNSASTIGNAWANLPANLGFGGGRAIGGPVSAGTSYLVGERGPELFMPSTGGSIIPNNKLSGGLTININGNTLLDNRAAEKIGDMIVTKLGMSTKYAY